MVSDTVYELCLPVLEDASILEEDRTDRLESLLEKETNLRGTALENAILDALWRFRETAASSPSPAPTRHKVVRRSSPAPWQMGGSSTPSNQSPRITSSSPAPPPGLGPVRPPFQRALSSTQSPFTSPRPSPRFAFSSPKIPHSPSLNAYEFPNESAATPEIYGDYGSDTVDWLVGDDAASHASSAGGAYGYEGGLNGGASAFIQSKQADMSPYDILRSVLGEGRSDEEIERALELNGYDLSNTIMTLMNDQPSGTLPESISTGDQSGAVLIGKSMSSHAPRPITPTGQQRSGVICKFWLSTGSCLRADCRFSHDLSNHICKYWMMGNCLAGDTCMFSHDPSTLINRLGVEDNGMLVGTPQMGKSQPEFQVQDYNSFPSLHNTGEAQWSPYQHTMGSPEYPGSYGSGGLAAPQSGFRAQSPYMYEQQFYRSDSRPGSRHRSREPTPSIPSVDDIDAFPSLGATAAKGGKKHHGKRGGHGHWHKDSKESLPSSLADVVRMSPSPGPAQSRRGAKGGKANITSREKMAAALKIPPPRSVPWLATGDKANKAYMKARQEAIKHGGLRNKFLQSAAQAWNRNDARAAKALSLRGQSENDLMRKAHREAARQLYEERNKDRASNPEDDLFVDLHGLHPEEAVSYLSSVLLEQQSSSQTLYAITGTGHHSKNGKDKIGKAVRSMLNEWRYVYREFSVPGDRNNIGGILGIDPRSYDKSLEGTMASDELADQGKVAGDFGADQPHNGAIRSTAPNNDDNDGDEDGHNKDEPARNAKVSVGALMAAAAAARKEHQEGSAVTASE
ncbi:MAG: Tlg2-vesicle protein [Chaenotheca gracillima]|nr:MAG: Tlg2-vesicle protein [Chaenotheca gracillima]